MQCSEFIEDLNKGLWVVAVEWRTVGSMILVELEDGALLFRPRNGQWKWQHWTKYFLRGRKMSGILRNSGMIDSVTLRIGQLLT